MPSRPARWPRARPLPSPISIVCCKRLCSAHRCAVWWTLTKSVHCALFWPAMEPRPSPAARSTWTPATTSSVERMLISRLIPLASALLLAGCASMAPSYERPAVPLPAQYGAGMAPAAAAAAALEWRGYFTDSALQRLIEQALAHNHDRRTAVLRVQEAQAAYGIQRSARYPTLGLSAEAARARTPADLSLTGHAITASQFQVGLGVSSWELDFWGRLASLNEAALQSFLATDAARRATTLSLIAQVADTYLGLREVDERLRLAQESAASQRESLRIFTRRFDVGSASRLELTQVQTLVAQADSLVVQLQQLRDQQAHALDLLLGSPAELPPMQTPAQAEAVWQLTPIEAG